MSSTTKPSPAAAARRKSSKPSKIITFKLSPKSLKKFLPQSTSIKSNDSSIKKESPPAASTTQANAASTTDDGNNSETNNNTPVPAGTPSSSMPPPTEGVKKKPGKRAAPVDPNAPPKVRGKPGPKKKARLEDGTIDHSATAPRATNTHRLGPRANQGVINEKLRALDRSGKPCRKWSRSGFQMKSFTGVVWDMPRWKAPPKIVVEGSSETQSNSGDSSKENKDNSQQPSVKSEKSNSNGDVDMINGTVENAASPASSLPAPQDITTTTTPVPVEA